MRITWKFLGYHERFSVELPGNAPAAPELATVVRYGSRARAVMFRSDERTHFQDGRTRERDVPETGAAVYRIGEEPYYPLLQWNVGGGKAWMFVEEDTNLLIDQLAKLVVVREDATGLPTVDAQRPLAGGDVRDPAERDVVIFDASGTDEGWRRILFERSGPFAAQDVVTIDEYNDYATVRLGTEFPLNVQCGGRTTDLDKLRTIAETARSSLAVE